jgi:iron-sulfur cluster repair protein YtfE (RIC family)
MSLWTVSALVEHILSTHHAYLKKTLPALAQLTDKVERVRHAIVFLLATAHGRQVHGASHPKLRDLKACFHSMHRQLDEHLWKEEVRMLLRVAKLLTGVIVVATALPSRGLRPIPQRRCGCGRQSPRAGASA